MKMEDVLPRARRVQHQGQVASSVGTVGQTHQGHIWSGLLIQLPLALYNQYQQFVFQKLSFSSNVSLFVTLLN